MTHNHTHDNAGWWVAADGSMRPISRTKALSGLISGGLFGLGSKERQLGGTAPDLARAYATAVWAYRCIKLRADSLASVPLILVERDGTRIAEHPLLTLLRDVNPHTMNLGDLLRATEAAYNIWGVAYWLVSRYPVNGRMPNQPRQIHWLNPQTVQVITDPAHGVTGYRQHVGGRTLELDAADVIAFRNFHPLDDLGGLSPLSVVLDEVNAERNAAQYVAAFFANDARPMGLLTTDQQLMDADLARVQTWWERLFRGAANRWKTGIVGGGLRWQPISAPPADVALADLRAEDRRAICAAFGVPPGLAGVWEAVTYATAREQKVSFYEDTLIPQMEYLAEVLNWALLPRYRDLQARGVRLAFDVNSIAALRENATAEVERLTKLFSVGVITRNEVRTALGMPPHDEDGTIFTLKEQEAEPMPTTDDDTPQDDAQAAIKAEERAALLAELKRWERFAVRRVKEGRRLRTFRSILIPVGLREEIEAALADALHPDEVRAAFADAKRCARQGTGEDAEEAA